MKRILLTLTLIFGFSGISSAAQICYVTQSSVSGVSVGDFADFDSLFSSLQSSYPDIRRSGGCSIKNGRSLLVLGRFRSGCPVGKFPNEENGKCEEADFCSSSEWDNLVIQENESCAAKHPNHWTNLKSSCTDRSNYSFTCEQGLEKPDTGGGDGSTGGGDGSTGGGDGSTGGGDGSTGGGDGSTGGGDGSTGGGDGSTGGGDGSTGGGDGSTGGGDGSTGGGDGSTGGGDGSTGGGDGSTGGGDGSTGGGDGSTGGGDGSTGGGNGSTGGGNGSKPVDLSGVISKINESNSLLGGIKKTTDSIGSEIGGLGDKLDDIANGSNTDVSGNNCELNSFSCSGNAYDCFIARQAWDNKCLISSLTGDIGTGEGVPVEYSNAVNDSGNALINELKDYTANKGNVDKLSNGEVALSDTLSKYNESNGFNFDDRCPSPTQVNYGLGSFELNFQPFCDLALYIRAMLMLTASIGSILMIAKHS